ncbi:LamG-like jellyroll fold domain-containing protein [uncultured Winogradskyella sp.]|uniref:LamG-like jellyroll fold domain-containing protein n=1 Tax=uncultured Winogradskyella sp. TaxID=395353 RepID=UPI00262BA218|nr:LamG-like jellyroll fold domain-containing protein [uncultured Winogradskyella sp.]
MSILVFIAFVIFYSCKQKENTQETTTIQSKYNDLKQSLTFYASFDASVDADFALGDASMYTVPNRQAKDSAKAGLHKPDITRVENQGKFGAGLKFTERSPGYIYYTSKNNIVYNTENWSAAISFWLRLDPNNDLKPGYCDPIQITDAGYNDAGIWVDFTKENPRDFRLGVIGDRNVWNPNPAGPDNENPIFIERLTGVKNPPFSNERWTHVVINFSGLNTENGEASLYLNGEHKGTRSQINTPFTWDYSLSNIYLGLGYIGLMDELSIYNRGLTSAEIKKLYELENGVQSLLE